MREIKGGSIRLHDDGRVEHWNGDICRYRPGWGPYAMTSTLGHDRVVLDAWRLCAERATMANELEEIEL
jgi:hypothetical protein